MLSWEDEKAYLEKLERLNEGDLLKCILRDHSVSDKICVSCTATWVVYKMKQSKLYERHNKF